MRCSIVQLASRRRQSSFRSSWMTPGLTPHQLLDAGVTGRQAESRKNLKRSRRPFDNYFRSEYRCSLNYSVSRMRSGRISSRDAARLQTNPNMTWEAPWGRAGGATRWRGKRQDAREAVSPQFGEDALDAILERLVEIRFLWDREDGVFATALVPAAFYARTEHCLPYSTVAENEPSAGEDDTEVVYLDGTPVHLRRPNQGSGTQKPKHSRPKWGFTGTDTVPSLVADATRGPLLSSSDELRLTPRWAASNRQAESVSEMLQLLQQAGEVPPVGLPPRSVLLLLKSIATAEMEDPALAVSIAIAIGENYYGYEMTECLEVLRCLRRLATVRGCAHVLAQQHTASDLYEDANLSQGFLGDYVRDVAPFLAQKVWSRLPEHSQRLLRHRLFLDWFDLLSLSVEIFDPQRLPGRLPNPASTAPYASKYLFLRYTLHMEESTVDELTSSLRAAVGTDCADAETERVQSTVLWLCAAFLARLVAEALGDVLHHVFDSLQHHADLAQEALEANLPPSLNLDAYLDRLSPPRPHIVGHYQLIGRRRPKQMRLRLLPYEAFPTISRCLPTPYAAQTRRAIARSEKRKAAAAAAAAAFESPFAKVLAASPVAVKHVERSTGALEWAVGMLRASLNLVQDLPTPSPSLGTAPADPTDLPTTPSASQADGTAAALRQALCERYVSSKVQLHLDSIFNSISWSELETKLEALLPAPPEETVEEVENALGTEKWSTSQGKMVEEAAGGFLDFLYAGDEPPPPKGAAVVVPPMTSAPVFTEAEKLAQQLLKELQARVEDFQTVVADLLDVHEAFFTQP